MVSAVTAMGYDAYFTALEALKLAGSTDPAAVLEALPNVSYEGVCGLIEFDEIGDAKRDQAYIKQANTETGAWDFVTVQAWNKPVVSSRGMARAPLRHPPLLASGLPGRLEEAGTAFPALQDGSKADSHHKEVFPCRNCFPICSTASPWAGSTR